MSSTLQAVTGVSLKKATDGECRGDLAEHVDRLSERLFAVQRELDAARREVQVERNWSADLEKLARDMKAEHFRIVDEQAARISELKGKVAAFEKENVSLASLAENLAKHADLACQYRDERDEALATIEVLRQNLAENRASQQVREGVLRDEVAHWISEHEWERQRANRVAREHADLRDALRSLLGDDADS
ncbi:hypothetical protein [Streptomyces sp. NPDC006134]|uniref:hypothetical protein n=1 Tax=Streptomyces sp. NPDC006134 TaxID=3154467 RepID=UPI0033F2DBFC